MKLYLVKEIECTSLGMFDSLVVQAESEEEAKLILQQQIPFEEFRILYIGEADPNLKNQGNTLGVTNAARK